MAPYFIKVVKMLGANDISLVIAELSKPFYIETGNKPVGYFKEIYRVSRDISILVFYPFSTDMCISKENTIFLTKEDALSVAIELLQMVGKRKNSNSKSI